MLSEKEIIKNIEQKLKRTGRFTVEDAAATTGIEINKAKRALDSLMEKYRCRLQVNEHGDIIYDFGKRPIRRGAKTIAEHWETVKEKSWKVFKFLFKVWITVTLVVYFVIFVLIVLALIVALLSRGGSGKSSSNKGGGGLGTLFHLIVRVFVELLVWNSFENKTHYSRDKYGYPYREFNSIEPALDKYRSRKKKNKKKFIASVFDFVFGPPRVDVHPLNNQREVATFLRKNKGIITLSELKVLAGWNDEEAGNFFSDCIVRFEGETKVSDNGVFYGDFKNFIRKVSKEKGAEVILYWDEYEPDYKLNGNTSGRNALIIFMNLFNLILSGAILYGYFSMSPLYVDFAGDLAWVPLVLGWIPVVFSTVFFAVPLIRMIKIASLRRKQHIENIRKRLMKVIYRHKGNDVYLSDLENAAGIGQKGEETLSERVIEKEMKDMIYDWGGETEVSDTAKVLYKFPRLKADVIEADRLRNERRNISDGNGKIVFDTY